MEKNQLRAAMLQRRRILSETQVAGLSREIVERVQHTIDWHQSKYLHTYLPIKQQNEVDTWPLLEYIWHHHRPVSTYTSIPPRIVTAASQLQTDRQGVPMPIGPSSREAIQFDTIVVPVVGFDENGHRLGFGGGSYDRFLSAQASAQKIGLCYEFGHLTAPLPAEAHDIKLNMVVTEKEVYRFG